MRPSHCLISLEQQREAHAEYKHSPCYIVKARVCVYTYTQKTYQIGTEGQSISRRTSIVAKSWNWFWKLRSFITSEQSANKRLLNMSWKPRLGCLVKQVGFPRGDISLPLNPGVELSGAKVQHFLHKCKKMAIFFHHFQFRGRGGAATV